jgi:UTP--glucose-1-phosphate uridylyltransferase
MCQAGFCFNPTKACPVEVKKAVITAAGKNQRMLPLQTLIDRDGVTKTALQILIEEVVRAGVEEIEVVVHAGDQAAYRAAAGSLANRLEFSEQAAPMGYGHAVACARHFTGREPFLLLVGDHLYLNPGPQPCTLQLIEVALSPNLASRHRRRRNSSSTTRSAFSACPSWRASP